MFRPFIRPTSAFVRDPIRANYATKPPSYFSGYLNKGNGVSDTHSLNSVQHSIASSPISPQPNVTVHAPSRISKLKDLSFVVAILSLSYFAVDNYRTKAELEQKHRQLSLKHVSSLATAQNNYNNFRKKREAQIVNERKKIQKREMRMVYHISMLRKQLIDAGLHPVEIDEAIAEFEKNVKMETSISNVSGTALWVVDDSPMKAYVPSIHEYESKK